MSTPTRNSIAASFGDRPAKAKPDVDAEVTPIKKAQKGKATLTSTGVEFTGVELDQDIDGDWSRVFAVFNMDAAAFEIVNDTVQISTWEQSASDGNGGRDHIQLWSYSARFKRKSAHAIPEIVLARWRKNLLVQDRPTKPTRQRKKVDADAYPIKIADPQLGKKWTEQAVENWQRGVRGHMAEVVAAGDAVNQVHIAFMGDETENVVNSYGNQPHTVELNRTQQLELDFEMRVWTIRQALATGKTVTASSVISNHGEWTRNGGKEPVTSANDNASTYIARQVKALFDELAPFTKQKVEWTIGETHPGIVVPLAGVDCYFSHGYIEKGKGGSSELRTKSAIERQILGRTDELGEIAIWFMAHYHHHYSNEFEGRTLFGCPAIEAEKSSEYMLDQFGVWSPPGVLGMRVGRHHKRGWSHLNIF